MSLMERTSIRNIVERQWRAHLAADERDLLSYLLSCTVEWGRQFVSATYEQLAEGIKSTEGSGYEYLVPPIRIKRTQFYALLSSLKERGILIVEAVKRKCTRIEINLNWTPVEGVMSPTLAVAKGRRKLNLEPAAEKDEFEQELGGLSGMRTTETAPPPEPNKFGNRTTDGALDLAEDPNKSGMRTEVVQNTDSYKKKDLKKENNLSPLRGSTGATLAIPKRKTEAGKVNHSPRREEISECLSPAAPPARAVAVESPAEIVQRVRTEHAEARAQRTEKVRHGDHPRDYEMTFRDAWLETYPGQSVPGWTQKDCYILKNVLKARFRDNVVRRHEFLSYVVKNWSMIMSSYFGWMRQSRPPEMPALNFLVREQFISHFLDAFAASGRDQALQLLPAEERELATLEAGGMTREKALLKIGERRALSKVADKEREVRQINRETLLAAGDARKAREEAQRAEMRRRAEAARQAPSQAAPEPFEELQGLPELELIELPPLDLSKWN
ncbi:hypothetical protein [Xanthobacter sp. 91]|uniref:hypothetical protein n=1 Tax=Xanthobacter sp. 91 TaxID=1117244 RepID=UPI0004979E5A|nr:hypothetical protein [Xanthobacter sp. 91]